MGRSRILLVCAMLWSGCGGGTVERREDEVALISAPVALEPGETALLASRLVMRFPEGASPAGMSRGIMQASSNDEAELRVIYDMGPRRFVWSIREVWEAVPAGSGPYAAELTETYGYPAAQPFEAGPGLDVQEMVFPVEQFTDDGTILARYIVVMPDSMVVYVEGYVNAAWGEDEAGARALLTESARSMRFGGRLLELQARPLVLADEREARLEWDLPDGTWAYREMGPDFWVWYLGSPTVVGGRSQWTTLVYFGGHPSARRSANATLVDGEFLGQPVRWERSEQDGRVRFETLVSFPGAEDFFVHAVVSAVDAATADAIFASLVQTRVIWPQPPAETAP